jgi:hypothetical protein
MAVIFVDTNLFLRFYESKESHLGAFDELVSKAQSIVLTEQVVNEFNRNRLSKLRVALKTFQESKLGTGDTAVVRALPSYAPLVEAREKYQTHAKIVERAIRELMQDRSKDPIATRFDELYKKCHKTYAISKKAIKRAHRRKLLGNPPTSPKQDTIGDEVNWETLLESCDKDLVICSQDGTFADNEAFLKSEYTKSNRQLAAIADSFQKALKAAGEPPSEELVKQEDSLENEIKQRRSLIPMTAAERFQYLVRHGIFDNDLTTIMEEWRAADRAHGEGNQTN